MLLAKGFKLSFNLFVLLCPVVGMLFEDFLEFRVIDNPRWFCCLGIPGNQR